jgi:pyridine nucleotide-disulfide oxidoreductase family protein
MLSKVLSARRLGHLLVMTTVINRRDVQEVLAKSYSTTTTSSSSSKSIPLAFTPFKKPEAKHDQKRLVLIGGGHAHVQVIKALNKASRPKNLHVTLIDVEKSASYSGMVPGCIAGMYKPEDTLIHLDPLAKWAGIDFFNDRVVDIDIDQNLICLEGNVDNPIPFDAISVDIGSASRGLHDTKGADRFTIPTRPISDLVSRLEAATKEIAKNPQQPVHVVVIGGGAAGIELSMSIMGRWKPILGKDNVHVTLLDSGSELLPDDTPANREALLQIISERGIDIRHGSSITEVQEDSVRLESGEKITFTHCLWATGAGAHNLAFRLENRGLAVSKRGWFRVNENLQSVSHPQVFAAGDCCTMEGLPNGSPPKAGVYAVRSGPVLIDNLTKFLDEENKEPLKAYNPQDDFLKLITCGDGTALGFRFGIPIQGKWVYQMKDAIDVGFMNLFKAKNLPKLVEGQPYNTSEYDATQGERPAPKEPSEAAALLQRTDDDVDFQEAWDVLRDMTQDEEYKKKVLEYMPIAEVARV